MLVNDSRPSASDTWTPRQVVLVLGAAGVHRVAALPVAVPEVDGGVGQGRAAGGGVGERQLDRHRHAVGDARRRSDARADVAAHDVGLGQHVRPVRSVAREWPGRLLGDRLAARRIGRRRSAVEAVVDDRPSWRSSPRSTSPATCQRSCRQSMTRAEFDALLVWAPEPSELQAANTVAPAAAAMASRPRRD